MNEECGVFGAFIKEGDAFNCLVEGLISLQHRGQESFGIAVYNKGTIRTFRRMGMVVSNEELAKVDLEGRVGIGHVRYSTKGSSNLRNAQPFRARFKDGYFALAHNGQIQNSDGLRSMLENSGSILLTDSDTELIMHILIKNILSSPYSWDAEIVKNVLFNNVSPSFSLLLLLNDRLMAFRDVKGYRPLFLCESEKGWFVASEDSAFNGLKSIKNIREIEAGEAIEIGNFGVRSLKSEVVGKSYCFFEQVYFSRPDSHIFGFNVHKFREELGRQCAIENPVRADIVVPVLDSGFSAAIGYSAQSKIPIEMGLMKNKYIGRTFINPLQSERKKGVLRKLSPIPDVVSGKRIVLVDDSMVRGTTMRSIVSMLRYAGALEIHVRIASPKVVNICKWGVDIPNKSKLIAYNKSLNEINDFVNADSTAYVSLNGIKRILGTEFENYCFHCFEKGGHNEL